MTLIPYAGRGESFRNFTQPARALMMFENGKDTLDIAKHFGVNEAVALRWISTERSEVRGLPKPYL